MKNLPPVLGSESFCEEVRGRFRDLVSNKEIRNTQYLAKDPEQIIEIVCRYFKVDRVSVNVKGRSSDNTARDVALYLIRMHRSETLSVVGSYFGLQNYSAVTGILLRFIAFQKAVESGPRLTKIHKNNNEKSIMRPKIDLTPFL